MSNEARICFDNMAVDATPTASHDQSGTAELVDGMTNSKWKPANASPTISYAGTFTDVDYIGLAGVNWETSGCSLVVKDAIGGNTLATFSGLGESQPALAIITQTSETVMYFEFTCDNTLLEVGEVYFGQSIVLPRKVEVGYQPSRWSNNDLVPTSNDNRNQTSASIVKSRGSTERLTLKYLDITFMEGVFKSFIRMAEGLPIFFIWDTLQVTHAIYGMWEVSNPSYISANYSSISMTIKGISEIVVDTGQSGSEGGNSAGFGSNGDAFTSGGSAFENPVGNPGSFWFRTSVDVNGAIDFWTLDEESGTSAINIGNGGTGFTNEPLDYNPSVFGATPSSISNGAGFAKNLIKLPARTLSGTTIESGSVFARSNTWGIEFALSFHAVVLSDQIVLSFWDSTAVTTAGADMLMKISIDTSDADVLNLTLYTTDDDSTFTLRTNVIVPSIAAMSSGFSYFSIFFISGSTLICRVNNVETLNVDISSWEARLSGVHATAKFRIGAEKDSPTVDVMSGQIDEVSTYASVSGTNFDTTRTYKWWADSNGQPLVYAGNYHWPFDESSGNFSSVQSTGVLVPDPAFLPTYSQTSLRKDLTGTSVDFDNANGVTIGSVSIPYSSGFTIEIMVTPETLSSSNGSLSGGVESNTNSAVNSVFVMRFDNFDGGSVVPTFSLLKRNSLYSNTTSHVNNVAEVRSTTAVILGNTYHLLATIRPSNGTIEFWVNGISIGTDNITSASTWFSPNGQGNSGDLLDGILATRFSLGNCYLNGAFRSTESTKDDLRVHLLEADDQFAYDQASFANYT